jgi:hypothetical protein
MSVAPLVRRVIVCRKVEVANAGSNQLYHLRGVVNTIRPAIGLSFPYREKFGFLFSTRTEKEHTNPRLKSSIKRSNPMRLLRGGNYLRST